MVSLSDIGWVGSHFFIYGCLMRGATYILYEGKVMTPNAGKMWQMCQDYKCKVAMMGPAHMRILKKLDYHGEQIKKHDLSCLKCLILGGERADPETVRWTHKNIPHVLINDTWGQTETGTVTFANMANTEEFGPVLPTLLGSVTRPFPGWDFRVFSEENEECTPGELGKLVIKLPLPPAFMLTLWGDD